MFCTDLDLENASGIDWYMSDKDGEEGGNRTHGRMQIFLKMENQGCLITALLSFGVEEFLQERNINYVILLICQVYISVTLFNE